MMKITGSCSLAVLVLTMGLMVAGCGGSQSPQEKIDSLVKEMQPQLPKTLDSDTRLVKVYSDKLELVSEYELLHPSAEEKARANSKKHLNDYLHSVVCTNIKNQLLSQGISSRYIYKTPEGEVFLDLVLKPGDC
jgi:hypothetical protein